MVGAVAIMYLMKNAVFTNAPCSLLGMKPVVIRTDVSHRQGYGAN
jgi:hypothetical protein